MTDALVIALREQHPRANPPTSRFWFFIDDDADRPMIADIQGAVARHFGITVHDLIADGRQKHHVLARHIGMYLCKSLTLNSYERIARLFNRCDYSISLWACRKITRLRKSDAQVAGHLEALEAQFR